MRAIIMAAGNGVRMLPLTETRPKCLLPVAGKPIAYHQLSELRKAGINEFVFIVREKKEQIAAYLSELQKELGFKLFIVEQGAESGTGSALLAAEGKADSAFVLVGGDLLFDAATIKQVIAAHKGGITVALKHVEHPEKYGIADVVDGKISYLEEKPKNSKSDLANLSIYCMDSAVFQQLKQLKKSPRGEYELTDLLVGATAVETDGYWKDVGYPWDLLDANKDLLQHMEAKMGQIENSTVNGKVIMEEGSKIINSYVEGDVYLGKNSIIGPNAYIRGPTAIGADCHIGESVTVKQSVIFDGVNAKHLAYIGDSVVGAGVNFGAGTQIANFRFDAGTVNVLTGRGWVNTGKRKLGAIIGDNVKFGVLSATMPGKLIGANSWVHSGVMVNENVPSSVYVYVQQQINFRKLEHQA
ncbi:MAG: bifunctional sugar-1-phosphate nucleotidylyltransferase/acetyltransferase [Candidatus Micrarchaeota archaeon]